MLKELDRGALSCLDDRRLLLYFQKHAKYYSNNPKDSQYSIRLESKSLFSHDTADLRDKFFIAVRKYNVS